MDKLSFIKTNKKYIITFDEFDKASIDTIFSREFDNTNNFRVSRRPLEVLQLLANGCPTIGKASNEIDLAVNTVNHHLSSAKKSLNANSTFHAIAIALRNGLIY